MGEHRGLKVTVLADDCDDGLLGLAGVLCEAQVAIFGSRRRQTCQAAAPGGPASLAWPHGRYVPSASHTTRRPCVYLPLTQKFKHLSTGHLFYIVNTHMDHVSEQARVEGTTHLKILWDGSSSFMNAACIPGAKVLLKTIEKLRRKNRAVIVTGDFNAAPGQGSYEVLRDGTAAVSSEP